MSSTAGIELEMDVLHVFSFAFYYADYFTLEREPIIV